MKKLSKIIISLMLVGAIVMSFAACSSGGDKKADGEANSSFDSAATLKGILENFKADEQYNEYKGYYPDATFEEKIEGNSILLNISGIEDASGSYEYKLDGDYLTYTQPANSEDYVGYSFFMYLKSAAEKFNGIDSDLATGYISGCEAFGIEDKYMITEEDEATGTTSKLYVAGKFDMPELDTMYINDKALEYTEALTDDDLNGVINCGKIRAIYYGNKNSADIIFIEFGERSDLTYQSMVNTIAKLQPNGADAFAKDYTELKETEGDGFKVTFALDESFAEEHSIEIKDGYSYTVVHFGE